jgi:gliding motility-associated-like protein
MKSLQILFCILLATNSGAQQSINGFLKNKGQVRNQLNQSDSSILYLFPSVKNYNVQLRKNAFAYDFYAYQQLDSTISYERKNLKSNEINIHRIDVEFLNSNPDVQIIQSNPQIHYYNFVKVSTDSTFTYNDVKVYKTLKYENLYPNIDLVFKVNEGGFKYDFIINPGGDIQDIQLKFTGFNAFNFSDSLLNFTTSIGQNQEVIPMSYYNDTLNQVEINYQLLEQNSGFIRVGFAFENINQVNPTETLIIDPEPDLKWAAYMGNSFFNENTDVITNKNGEIFIGGSTLNLLNFATTGENTSIVKDKNVDAFITKSSKNGNLLWTTIYQGNYIDFGENIQVDSMLNCYLIGTSIDSTLEQNKNVFALKLNKFGFNQYEKKISGDTNQFFARSITDFSGNLYLSYNQKEIFNAAKIIKFDNNGNELWSHNIIGENDVIVTDISFGNHQVIAVGYTVSNTGITAGISFQADLNGEKDAFVISIDSLGNRTWGTYFGGENTDEILGVKAFNEDIFITGRTNSETNIGNTNSFQENLSGDFDGFVANFHNNGNLNWSSYFGGIAYDDAVSISRELDSNIFIFGNTNSQSGLATSNTYQMQTNSEQDMYFAKFDRLGNQLWSTYYGGEQEEQANAIHVYGNTSVYLAGKTKSNTHIIDSLNVSFSQNYFGNDDGFLAKFTQDKSTIYFPDNLATGGAFGCEGGCNSAADSLDEDYTVFYRCLGDTLFLSFNSGELGTDAQWVWYLDSCGGENNQIGVGESIFYIPSSSCSINVRAEGITTATQCITQFYYFAPIPEAIILTDSMFCGNGIEILWTNPVDTIRWYKNDSLIGNEQNLVLQNTSISDNGTYKLEVTNYGNCSNSSTINLSFLVAPSYSDSIANIFCQGNETGEIHVLLEDNSNTINWLDFPLQQGNVLDSLSAGTYYFEVVATNLCSIRDSATITAISNVSFDSIITHNLCGQNSGSIQLIPSIDASLLTFTWQNSTDSLAIRNNLIAGVYAVEVKDSNACLYNFNFSLINEGQLNFAVAAYQDTIILGDSIDISIVHTFSDTTINFTWVSGTETICENCTSLNLNPINTSTYQIFANSENSCSGLISFTIVVIDTNSIVDPIDTLVVVDPEPIDTLFNSPCMEVFIPDHFSPNNDGINDEWCVIGECLLSCSMRVYNQWNELIFTSDNQAECWDGKFKGYLVQGDVYFYVLQYETLADGIVNRTGNIIVQF